MTLRIEIPWPDKRLSPNARLHWRPKAAITAKARADAHFLALEAAGYSLGTILADLAGEDRIPLTVTFYPPDRRHRDDDGMVSMFKAARDGIADALHVNDRRFAPNYRFETPEKPGKVVVEIGHG
jgi:crossover junction endodeoxyribonuclease RusA